MSSAPDPKKPNFFENLMKKGGSKRKLKNWNLKLVAAVAILWSLFQLWYASPLPFILDFGKIIDVPARSVHLAFGLALCFWLIQLLKKIETDQYQHLIFFGSLNRCSSNFIYIL